jgi:hypothetical protein
MCGLLLALPATRLAIEVLQETNTLAYFAGASVTKKKKLYDIVPTIET